MSAKKAMEQHYGKMNNYRAAEGRELKIPYRGALTDIVEDYLGGLRSACTYAGAQTLKALPKCPTFVRVNRQLNEVFS